MRRASIAIGVVLLMGCAGPSYMMPGVSEEVVQRDYAACQYEAAKATASAPGGSIGFAYQVNTTLANDVAVGIRQGEIISACMQAKGYRLAS